MSGASLLQLNPPLHVETACGPALMHVFIHEGPESDIKLWGFMEHGGEPLTVPNPAIRGCLNWSYGRRQVNYPARIAAPWEKPNQVKKKKRGRK